MPLTLNPGQQTAGSASLHRLRQGSHAEEISTLEERHGRALETYGPPSVVINENHVVLHVSETAGRYLLQPRGPLTGDLLQLVRPELQLELRTAIFQASEKDRAIVSNPVFVQFNGHPHRVVLAVRPIQGPPGAGEKEALVLFLENELDETFDLAANQAGLASDQGEPNELVARLQAENRRLREQLQVTIEEYDSSNEEIKAANEELQSINEELLTVNNELKMKLDELAAAHQELENLMGAT
jgi:two-component system, chemotaxis family, CheB/CheR fusion protein